MNIKSYIKDNFLVWTMTSNGYKYYTLNLYESLKKANVSFKLMIICIDIESYKFLLTMNVDCIYHTIDKISSKELGIYGSELFMSMNKIKLDLMEYIRSQPISELKYIIYMDGDIVVLKDFLPYLKEKFETNLDTLLFIQNDHKYMSDKTYTNGCTGFFCFRNVLIEKSPFLIDSLEQWKIIREDQVWVNKKLDEYSIKYEYLDRELFPNGVYTVDNRLKSINPYIIHFNYMVGNTKKQRMKSLKYWYLIY